MPRKMYPFSVQKHAHDIEFRRNRTYNIMRDMEMGEFPWDGARYDELEALHGSLTVLLSAVLDSRDGIISYLTGPQIGLAKETVLWASVARASAQEAKGES